jgi:hypothetical protein
VSAYEQKTQHSPARGRSTVRQPEHSKKCRQASSGISSWLSRAHTGHRSVAYSLTDLLGTGISLTHIAQVCGGWTIKDPVDAKLRSGLA